MRFRALLACLLSIILCAAVTRAQEDGAVLHPDHGRADTGWTASGAGATPADSLAAFRPDSLKDEVIKSAESAPSPFAAKAGPRDSADSVAALLRGRRPTLSFHLAVEMTDLDAQETFARALEARRGRDSLEVLQPYESVLLAFPAGLQLSIPVGPWFDLVARTHSSWASQTAVLGKGGATVDEEFFAVQAHLGGIGLRYYVPPTLLSVNGELGLYVQGVYYWLLGGGELYTHHGSATAEFDPTGSAWEILLGFNKPVTRSWSLTGNLGFLSQSFASDAPWTAVAAFAAPAGKVEWSMAAVQASFSLAWHFGVDASETAPK